MILDRIVETKREEVKSLYQTYTAADLKSRCAELAPTRGFHSQLRMNRGRLDSGVSLIAEVKKASPSKGLIRPDFYPAQIAEAYERAGASAVSVLTDAVYFQGSGEYLGLVREKVQLPLLRKDFIIDEIQIPQSRLLGADAILLIVAILSQTQIQEYLLQAAELGLDALVEVHDEREASVALEAGASLVGVNNRDLRDFSVDLGTTARVARLLPETITLVAESGLSSRQDVDQVRASGASAILVGESLMRKQDIEAAVQELAGARR